MTKDKSRCTSCNNRLEFNFRYVTKKGEKGKKIPIHISYKERDWKPTKIYTESILPIIQARSEDTSSPDELIALILNDPNIPPEDKVTINGFVVFQNFDNHPVVQVWVRSGQRLFNSIEKYAKKTGIYLHVTGPPLPQSLVSRWFDKYVDTIIERELPSLARLDPHDTYTLLLQITGRANQNSMLLKMCGLRILLDAGFNFSDPLDCDELVENIDPENIDLVIISHAHRDHINGLVDLYERFGCTAPIITTRSTIEIGLVTDYRYNDFLSATKKNLGSMLEDPDLTPLEQETLILDKMDPHLKSLMKNLIPHLGIVNYGDLLEFDESFKLSILQAGHFPGAFMTSFVNDDYSIMYTGDFNLLEFEPISSCRSAIQRVNFEPDVIICDGSAADLHFLKEEVTKARLYSDIVGVYQNEGITLLLSDQNLGAIVTFFTIRQSMIDHSKGRISFYFDSTTWDQMCILRDRAEDLAKSVQQKIQNHEDPFHSVMIRRLESEYPHYGGFGLRKAIKEPCVISMDARLHGKIPKEKIMVLEEILKDEKNMIVVIGAPKSTVTQDLISKRKKIQVRSEYDDSATELEVSCRVFNWDIQNHQIFNYHPDQDQLIEFFDTLMPKRVVFFHNTSKAFYEIRRKLSDRPYIEDHEVLNRFVWIRLR